MNYLYRYLRSNLVKCTASNLTMYRASLAVIVVVIILPAKVLPQDSSGLTQLNGEILERKLAELSGNNAPSDGNRDSLILYEQEVNSYLRFQADSSLPVGVAEAFLSLNDGGRVVIDAVVDLSLLAFDSSSNAINPLSFLSGVMPVSVSFYFRTAEGEAVIEIETVTVGGLSVPLSFVQRLVRDASQSETYPNGIDVSKPFLLPHSIVEVLITRGQALIIR